MVSIYSMYNGLEVPVIIFVDIYTGHSDGWIRSTVYQIPCKHNINILEQLPSVQNYKHRAVYKSQSIS